MNNLYAKRALAIAASILFSASFVQAEEKSIPAIGAPVALPVEVVPIEPNRLSISDLKAISFSNTDALIGSVIYTLSPFLSADQIEALTVIFQTADSEFSDLHPQRLIDEYSKSKLESTFNENEFKFQLLTKLSAEIGLQVAMVETLPSAQDDVITVGPVKSDSDFSDLVYALPLLALGGVGGGGSGGAVTCGGGACAPIYSEGSFQTTEYNNQAGLGLLKAAGVYSYGGSGSGVTVAVFDSGLLSSHSEFSGSRVLTGYDYVVDSAGVTSDPNGHGTHVTGIIAANRNSTGMHGVAYEAKILPLRIINAAGTVSISDTQLGAAIDFSTNSGVRINNHSWGSTTAITTVTAAQISAAMPQALAAFQRAAAAGSIQVFAAGNSALTQPSYQAGLPYRFPELQSTWLAVMSVDLSGAEPNYTNRCGVAAAWCIAAPGGSDNQAIGGVYSTTNDGAYGRKSGTSMATPQVAGGLAALKSRFPNLSYTQIRDRILTTANRAGAYANSAIYGQGLMDLSAAASPVGVLSIPLGGETTARQAPLGTSNLKISPALLSSFDFKSDQSVLVLDSYQNAPFTVATSDIIKVNPTKALRFSSDALFVKAGWSFGEPDVTTDKQNIRSYANSALAWKSDESNRWYFGADMGGTLSSDLGFSSRLPTYSSTPLAGFSTEISPAFIGKLRVGSWLSLNDNNAGSPIAISSEEIGPLPNVHTGVAVSKSWQIGEGKTLDFGAAFGRASRSLNNIFGTEAFSNADSHVRTNWLGLHKNYPTNSVGSGALGLVLARTAVDTAGGASLLKLPEELAVFDVEASGVWVLPGEKTKFKVGLATSFAEGNPNASLSLPISVDEYGSIAFQQFHANLKSSLKENRLSFKFEHSYNRATQLRVLTKLQQSNGSIQKLIGAGLIIQW